jgi:hypothetical protein
MAARRVCLEFPELSVAVIDREVAPRPKHLFHIHRYINDIPGLDEATCGPMHKFVVSVWDGKQFKLHVTIQDVNQYGLKIFGTGQLKISNIQNISSHPVLPIRLQELEGRVCSGIAFSRIASKVVAINKEDHELQTSDYDVIGYDYLISTIPLPMLLSLCQVKHNLSFRNYPIWAGAVSLGYNSSCYQVLMNTDHCGASTRMSLMDDTLFIEANDDELNDHDSALIEQAFGLTVYPESVNLGEIKPGRIDPLPRSVRKPLLHWLTEKHDIFTLGRYGAWVYKVANDVWEDTTFLAKLIYAKHQSKIYERSISDE